MLNHLRFYLPEIYLKLHKILFLDDDIMVQKDLTSLWKIDMDRKVNGAVETCFGSIHRYARYMNFSHPLIKVKFNPKARGWAYGLNFFDLDAWRKEKCIVQYHYWQNLEWTCIEADFVMRSSSIPDWPLLSTYLISEASLMESSRWSRYISTLPCQPYSLLYCFYISFQDMCRTRYVFGSFRY